MPQRSIVTRSWPAYRAEPGPGYIGFPNNIEKRHLEEITAEEKVDGIWQRKEHAANETLDLLVYSEVALLRLPGIGSDTSLAGVPPWARPMRKPVAAAAPVPDLKAAARKRPRIRTGRR